MEKYVKWPFHHQLTAKLTPFQSLKKGGGGEKKITFNSLKTEIGIRHSRDYYKRFFSGLRRVVFVVFCGYWEQLEVLIDCKENAISDIIVFFLLDYKYRQKVVSKMKLWYVFFWLWILSGGNSQQVLWQRKCNKGCSE